LGVPYIPHSVTVGWNLSAQEKHLRRWISGRLNRIDHALVDILASELAGSERPVEATNASALGLWPTQDGQHVSPSVAASIDIESAEARAGIHFQSSPFMCTEGSII
jgi:hypothetical protein